MRRAFLLALLALGCSSKPDAPADPRAPGTPEASTEAPAAKPAPTRQTSIYRLTLEEQIKTGERALGTVRARGVWRSTPLPDGGYEISFRQAAVEGPFREGELDGLEHPVHLRPNPDGALTLTAFHTDMKPTARDMVINIATTWWTQRGQGTRWETVGADALGLMAEQYEALPDGSRRRTRGPYVRIRQPKTKGTITGTANFRLDDQGLVSLESTETTAVGPDVSGPEVQMLSVQSTLKMERTEVVPAKASPAENLKASPLRIHRQGGGETDLSKVSLTDLFIRLGAAGTDAQRTKLMSAMMIRVQQDAANAEQIAAEIKNRAGAPKAVGTLIGALAASSSFVATDALARLLTAEPPMPAPVRKRLMVALGTTRAPTARSAEALIAQLDDPALGQTAARALGAQARALARTEPSAANQSVETLIGRYQAGKADADRRIYVEALARSGDPRILPVMEKVMASKDPEYARWGVFGLRYVNDAQADELLQKALHTRALSVEALKAIGFRSRETWQPRLQQASLQDPEAQKLLEKLLARWAAE